MGTVLVRFLDTGERVTTSRRALRRIGPVRAHVKSTFSIVAADPEAGEVGCAVQSKYFAVGTVVPWARAGVGAVATQAAGVAVYGPRALAELEGGAAPADALARVLAGDDQRETRQLGAVTAAGESGAYTGAECLDLGGPPHRAGLRRTGEHPRLGGRRRRDGVRVRRLGRDAARAPAHRRARGRPGAGRRCTGAAVRGRRGGAGRGGGGAARGHRPRGRPARGRPPRADPRAPAPLRDPPPLGRARASVAPTTGRASYELGAAILREALDDLGEDASSSTTSRASRRSPARRRRPPRTSSVRSSSTRASAPQPRATPISSPLRE